MKYEIELTEFLVNLGFVYSYLYEKKDNPTIYYKTLLKNGIPLIKMKVIKEIGFAVENPLMLKKIISHYSDYDVGLLDGYISRYKINTAQIGYAYIFKKSIWFIDVIFNKIFRFSLLHKLTQLKKEFWPEPIFKKSIS